MSAGKFSFSLYVGSTSAMPGTLRFDTEQISS